MRRRDFLSGVATTGLLASGAAQAQAKEVVFNGAGGTWQDNVRKAWLLPFTEATGTKVLDTTPFDLGKLSTMVRTGTVPWDLTDIPAADVGVAIDRDLVEPIDYALVDRSTLPPENYGDRFVVYTYFSANIVFDRRHLPGPAVPTSWADFFDLRRFPGARAFRRQPAVTLEAALIADGVPMGQLYPLDLDRAFRKLDTIKSDIRWWASAQQSVQLIANGEVAMGVTFSSRAIAARGQGAPLEIVWNQGALDGNYFVVPKGARNKDAAMRLIDFIIRPAQQARMATLNRSAPANPKAFELFDATIAADLPTDPAHRDLMFRVDNVGYWAKNSAAVTKRFESWLVA